MAEDFDIVKRIANVMTEHTMRGGQKRSWGIRTVDEHPGLEPGDAVPPSRIWRNGEPTNRKLSGISTVGIRSTKPEHIKAALDRSNGRDHSKAYYFGDHVMLVHGDGHHGGTDEGERVIHSPVMAALYKKPDYGPSDPHKVVASMSTEEA